MHSHGRCTHIIATAHFLCILINKSISLQVAESITMFHFPSNPDIVLNNMMQQVCININRYALWF